MDLPKTPTDDFKRLNPTLYPVAGLGGQERERNTDSALVRYKPRQPSRKGSVAVLVTIIACRSRAIDDDNSGMGGTKALRDAIAESLQCDDGSERIKWEYGQCRSDVPGTIVKIQRL